MLISVVSVFSEAAGAIYTRWGRKDCTGNGTELVYEGNKTNCVSTKFLKINNRLLFTLTHLILRGSVTRKIIN